jgi:hypothetical protein
VRGPKKPTSVEDFSLRQRRDDPVLAPRHFFITESETVRERRAEGFWRRPVKVDSSSPFSERLDGDRYSFSFSRFPAFPESACARHPQVTRGRPTNRGGGEEAWIPESGQRTLLMSGVAQSAVG